MRKNHFKQIGQATVVASLIITFAFENPLEALPHVVEEFAPTTSVETMVEVSTAPISGSVQIGNAF